MSGWVKVVDKPRNTLKPYAVRWRVQGHQHEKSFATRREAETYHHELQYRLGSGTFIDPMISAVRFRDCAEAWLASGPRSENTLRNYRSVLNQHINPVFGDRAINRVAHNLNEFRDFLLRDLPAKGVSASTIHTAKMIITGTVRDAIATGKLRQSQGAIIFGKGVRIPPVPTRAEIYFASYEELQRLADGLPEPYGLLVWLMRGCGLRIGEALAVKHEDIQGGVLRVSEQYTAQRKYAPLKHRKAGQYRDAPCPDYLTAMIPPGKGYIFPPAGRTTLQRQFLKARDAAGLPTSFTWHTLRHIFVSIALREGVPITDASRWIGHASINTTQGTYGHLVPRAIPRARAALDREYEEWSKS